MKNTTALITLGILTALVPFSGLPGSWRNVLCVIFGLSIAGIVFYYVRTHCDTCKVKEEEQPSTAKVESNNDEPQNL